MAISISALAASLRQVFLISPLPPAAASAGSPPNTRPEAAQSQAGGLGKGSPASKTWRVALGIAALATAVRLIPATLTFGTSDVMSWELLGRLLLDGQNFYATQLHNWPVLWIYFTAGAWLANQATGLPFSTLVKLPPIAADACIAALLYRVGLRRGWSHRQATMAGIAYALNPVSILITGYHGQFDSMMLAPTFLAWHVWDTWQGRRRLVGSALALGLGIWFKPVPLLLLPVLLPRLASWRDRVVFTGLAIAPATLGTLPYLVMWPEDVATNFLGYSSWFGQWGYPVAWMVVEYVRFGTIPWWLPDPDYVSRPLQLMYAAGRWVLLGALGATWWFTYRPIPSRWLARLPSARAEYAAPPEHGNPPSVHRLPAPHNTDVLRSIVATFAVFYFATSGFGLQYLLWIVPFALAARERWLWPFTVAATGLLLVAYTFGLAYLAPFSIPADNSPDRREFLVKLATLPTWLVCGLWAWSLLRRGRDGALERREASGRLPSR